MSLETFSSKPKHFLPSNVNLKALHKFHVYRSIIIEALSSYYKSPCIIKYCKQIQSSVGYSIGFSRVLFRVVVVKFNDLLTGKSSHVVTNEYMDKTFFPPQTSLGFPYSTLSVILTEHLWVTRKVSFVQQQAYSFID